VRTQQVSALASQTCTSVRTRDSGPAPTDVPDLNLVDKSRRRSSYQLLIILVSAVVGMLLTGPAKADPIFGYANVISDFGAKGDNKTDDTDAIQAAISSRADGGTVYFPPGMYKITQTLVASNVAGLHLLGAGVDVAIISPTPALSGQPVIEMENTVDSSVEKMTLWGNDEGAPSAAIDSHEAVGGYTTHLTLRDLDIGSPTLDSLIDGVTFTCDPNDDNNNENAFIENVRIYNFTKAGYEISMLNSEENNIVGGSVEAGPIGILTEGGNYKVSGTNFSVSQTIFDLEPGTYIHSILIESVDFEGGAGILYVAPTVDANIAITEFDYHFGSQTPIQIEGPSFVSISDSDLRDTGTVTFGAGSSVTLSDDLLDFDLATVDGDLASVGNCWTNLSQVTTGAKTIITESNELCHELVQAAPVKAGPGKPLPRVYRP
jgi:hypothetical protein